MDILCRNISYYVPNYRFFRSNFYKKIFDYLVNYKFIYQYSHMEADLKLLINELDFITDKNMKFSQFQNLNGFLDNYFN